MDRNSIMQDLAERSTSGAVDAVLIAGPTASGKSAIAIELAERTGGVVINADSMQVYADLRILSARPDAAEMARVPHHLFGHVDGGREYSVGDYLGDASPLFAALKSEGKLAVLAGGTGLYFKALTEGLVATPEVPEIIRDRWVEEHARGTDLHAVLRFRDPLMAERLAPADAPRLQRALGVLDATGQSLLDWQRAGHSQPLLAPGRWAGLFLDPPRDILNARINSRFEAMMREGALDEVRRLALRGLPANRGVMKAHGVPHLIEYLRGNLSIEEAVALGQRDTRRYAKRQLTWARKFMVSWRWSA